MQVTKVGGENKTHDRISKDIIYQRKRNSSLQIESILKRQNLDMSWQSF